MRKEIYSNRNKLLKVLVIGMMLFMPMTVLADQWNGGPGEAGMVSAAPYVTQNMCTPWYWLSQSHGTKEELLTFSEILELNREIARIPETKVVDLEQLDPYFDGIALRDERAAFESPQNLYLNGQPVPESYYQAIRENIHGASVQSQMSVKYGFTVNQTLMKAYPYADFLSDSSNDREWDQFASSAVYVNEPVVVYFFTKDGKYAYGQTSFCDGFIPVQDIAICKDKAEWTDAKTMEDILVVTGDKVYLEADAYSPEISEKRLSMGTVLERVKDADGSVDGRQTWNNYVVKIPCRAEDGSFVQKLALIPMNRDVSTDYLKYTTENVLDLAFKCLGDRYGWGGMLYSQDCSGYVKDIYRCFNLNIPRNTTWQASMPVETQSLENMTIKEKENVLNTLLPGTILQFKGHEMLYLGKQGSKYYVISNVSSLSAADDTTDEIHMLRVRSVIVNDLTTRRGNGHTWMEDLNNVIKVYDPIA